jgi:hypothetical protein
MLWGRGLLATVIAAVFGQFAHIEGPALPFRLDGILLLSVGKAVLGAIGICKRATAVKSRAGVGTRHGFVPIQMVDTVDRYRPRGLKLKIVCRITDLRLKTEENIATPT